jgi:hypothetical protein
MALAARAALGAFGGIIENRTATATSPLARTVVNPKARNTRGCGGIGRRARFRCVLPGEAMGMGLQGADFREAGNPRQPPFPQEPLQFHYNAGRWYPDKRRATSDRLTSV